MSIVKVYFVVQDISIDPIDAPLTTTFAEVYAYVNQWLCAQFGEGFSCMLSHDGQTIWPQDGNTLSCVFTSQDCQVYVQVLPPIQVQVCIDGQTVHQMAVPATIQIGEFTSQVLQGIQEYSPISEYQIFDQTGAGIVATPNLDINQPFSTYVQGSCTLNLIRQAQQPAQQQDTSPKKNPNNASLYYHDQLEMLKKISQINLSYYQILVYSSTLTVNLSCTNSTSLSKSKGLLENHKENKEIQMPILCHLNQIAALGMPTPMTTDLQLNGMTDHTALLKLNSNNDIQNMVLFKIRLIPMNFTFESEFIKEGLEVEEATILGQTLDFIFQSKRFKVSSSPFEIIELDLNSPIQLLGITMNTDLYVRKIKACCQIIKDGELLKENHFVEDGETIQQIATKFLKPEEELNNYQVQVLDENGQLFTQDLSFQLNPIQQQQKYFVIDIEYKITTTRHFLLNNFQALKNGYLVQILNPNCAIYYHPQHKQPVFLKSQIPLLTIQETEFGFTIKRTDGTLMTINQ